MKYQFSSRTRVSRGHPTGRVEGRRRQDEAVRRQDEAVRRGEFRWASDNRSRMRAARAGVGAQPDVERGD